MFLVCEVLQFVSQKEKLDLPAPLATKIAVSSGRNVRKAILMLESLRVKQYPFAEDSPIVKAGIISFFIDNDM